MRGPLTPAEAGPVATELLRGLIAGGRLARNTLGVDVMGKAAVL